MAVSSALRRGREREKKKKRKEGQSAGPEHDARSRFPLRTDSRCGERERESESERERANERESCYY